MTNIATQPAVRRPELASWSAGDNGRHLVRNRQSGESFQLGEEERFLLAQLDGRRAAEEICAAFAQHFDQPLSEEDLEEFIELATQRGLLQVSTADGATADPGSLEEAAVPGSTSPVFWKRSTSRLLRGISAVLRWSAWPTNWCVERIAQRLRHLEFVPREDDIFIVTYPRSGTTWMQMILYQLTTEGSMDFPHIAEYCPWFERSSKAARAFGERPSPRLFKSHLSYPKIPKGPGRYIYVARDGKDVAVSYYHLHRGYNGYEGTFAEFFERFLRGKDSFGSWFAHVKGWWQRRSDPNVLFLTYEELSRDLQGTIRKIAAFIGREVPPEKLPTIVEKCRFAFMKQYENQFDPVMESLWEQQVQLKSFLRSGRVGDGKINLTDEQQARFNEAFDKRLGTCRFHW